LTATGKEVPHKTLQRKWRNWRQLVLASKRKQNAALAEVKTSVAAAIPTAAAGGDDSLIDEEVVMQNIGQAEVVFENQGKQIIKGMITRCVF
jgi:hypothetical protein